MQSRAGLHDCATGCTAHAAHLLDEVVSSISVCRHLPSIRCPLVQAPGPWRVRPAWRLVPVAAILGEVGEGRKRKKQLFVVFTLPIYLFHIIHTSIKY